VFIYLTVILVFLGGDFYGKLRADYLAIVAVKTFGLIDNYWQEIPFGIQFVAHLQDFSRTKIHTPDTTLAPFFVYVYLARSCGYL